uniref:Ribonuclease H n=1 Tax=Medicago truncatula TaxID=3880 RepID=A2Q5T4_MEDTR|nr:Ribonuclease H [Medicago truncatula]
MRISPAVQGRVKINLDGSAFGAPSCGATGGVFRNWQTHSLGGFAQNIGHATCFKAELCAAIFAIEKSIEYNLRDIWLETDSKLVVKAFSSSEHVPWQLRTRWNNCLALAQKIKCVCTHIHREGNAGADSLAKNGKSLALLTSQWWSSSPLFFFCSLFLEITQDNHTLGTSCNFCL